MINKYYDKTKNFIKEIYPSLIAAVIVILLFVIQLPYKVYTPGGMVDLSKRIKIDNKYESEGSLGMAYVSVINGNIPYLLMSYIIPNWDIYPDEAISDEDFETTFKIDKLAMQESIDNATINAYKLAKKPVEVTGQDIHITYIDKDAKTDVALFDILLKIDGQEIKNFDQMRDLINDHKVGDKLSLEVKRGDEILSKEAEIYNTEDGPKIGLAITPTYQYDEDPKIEFLAKESESGPSGGLMMSLAIYNSLVPEDITKGKKIIGTGTIDLEGNVGEIGGVKYKLLGAANKKCEVFLVPKGNYEEAQKVKEEKNLNINIISVSTLDEAITELRKL